MPPANVKAPEAEAREYVFTADKGVQMFDGRVQFTHVPGFDTPYGQKRYRFATTDAALAGRVRDVKKYGITEVQDA